MRVTEKSLTKILLIIKDNVLIKIKNGYGVDMFNELALIVVILSTAWTTISYTNNQLELRDLNMNSLIQREYTELINVSATEHMPMLNFELTGRIESDEFGNNVYFPAKITVKTNEDIIQEIIFYEDDFAPCGLDNFGF